MLPLERQNQILDILAQRKAITVDELCHLLYSSGATIRRDLAILENNGQLKRTHGGAVFLDASAKDFPLMLRESENLMAKQVIARKALPLIQDGQTLFFDSSSTVCRLAELLNGFGQLRVITNGLKTAGLLADVEGVELYSTGGRLRETAKSFIGPSANRFINQFNADYAFLSCRGVDPATGVTEASEEEADVKLSYIQNARRVVLLCDASKLGKQFFRRIASLNQVWRLISNVPELPVAYGDRLMAGNRENRPQERTEE
jgi:DeoR/GlpR family transcriptional regulator of sugar metabolism